MRQTLETILRSWPLLLLMAAALLSGCARSASGQGTTRLRSPSMTDPDPLTRTFADTPRYIACDPP